MHREFALGVGESFVVEHPCGSKQTVINIEGIEQDAGQVDMLLQTWQNKRLVKSQRITLATAELGTLHKILAETSQESVKEAAQNSGFNWSR